MLSMQGLVTSMPSMFPLPDLSSSREDTTLVFPQLHFQIGRGVPQYLWRLMHQSLALAIQSFSRPEPAHSGYHLTFEFAAIRSSLISVTLRNHWSVTL